MILNDIANVVDCEHKTAPTEKTGYPSIRTPNIGRGRLILAGVNRVSKKTYDLWARRAIPQTHDLILAREAPVGNVAIIPNGLKVCLGQRTVLIQPDRKNVNPHYLTYLLLGNEIQGRFKSVSTGATVAHLNVRDIRDLPLPELPPLETQRKIAAILSAYDDLIENNLRRIKILEEMAQRLYREWFVNFRFPGHENVRMVDSPLGKIPQGWEVTSLSGLVETQYGYTESAQTKPVGPKFLRGMDINKQSYIDWSAVPYCPMDEINLPKFRLAVGDVLVIRMADPGKVGIVEREVEAVFASYLVRLRIASDKILPYFLFYFLKDERYRGYITGASTGTTRKSASAGVIVGIQLVVPPKRLMGRFVTRVEAIRRLINNLLERRAILRQTRDLLLPRFISGELDVSELDIKTPYENDK